MRVTCVKRSVMVEHYRSQLGILRKQNEILTSSTVDAGDVQFVNDIESSLRLAILVESFRFPILSLASLLLVFRIAS